MVSLSGSDAFSADLSGKVPFRSGDLFGKVRRKSGDVLIEPESSEVVAEPHSGFVMVVSMMDCYKVMMDQILNERAKIEKGGVKRVLCKQYRFGSAFSRI